MTEKIEAYLLSCIPPKTVCTRTDNGLESMYFSYYSNNLSDEPILHIRSSAIIDLKMIKQQIEDKDVEMILSDNEWLIYKTVN